MLRYYGIIYRRYNCPHFFDLLGYKIVDYFRSEHGQLSHPSFQTRISVIHELHVSVCLAIFTVAILFIITKPLTSLGMVFRKLVVIEFEIIIKFPRIRLHNSLTPIITVPVSSPLLFEFVIVWKIIYIYVTRYAFIYYLLDETCGNLISAWFFVVSRIGMTKAGQRLSCNVI